MSRVGYLRAKGKAVRKAFLFVLREAVQFMPNITTKHEKIPSIYEHDTLIKSYYDSVMSTGKLPKLILFPGGGRIIPARSLYNPASI